MSYHNAFINSDRRTFLRSFGMSSKALSVDELSFEAYSAYYSCLRQVHGEVYANMICGNPDDTVYFEGYSYGDLEKSFKSQCCIDCGTYITADEVEDCTFEGVEEQDEDRTHIFYLCIDCQDEEE